MMIMFHLVGVLTGFQALQGGNGPGENPLMAAFPGWSAKDGKERGHERGEKHLQILS